MTRESYDLARHRVDQAGSRQAGSRQQYWASCLASSGAVKRASSSRPWLTPSKWTRTTGYLLEPRYAMAPIRDGHTPVVPISTSSSDAVT